MRECKTKGWWDIGGSSLLHKQSHLQLKGELLISICFAKHVSFKKEPGFLILTKNFIIMIKRPLGTNGFTIDKKYNCRGASFVLNTCWDWALCFFLTVKHCTPFFYTSISKPNDGVSLCCSQASHIEQFHLLLLKGTQDAKHLSLTQMRLSHHTLWCSYLLQRREHQNPSLMSPLFLFLKSMSNKKKLSWFKQFAVDFVSNTC